MPAVTNTITLEIAPIGDKFTVKLWVGSESVRVKYPLSATLQEAQVWAGMFRGRLREYTCADVVVVERESPAPAAGPQPDMFPIKP